MLSSPDLGKVRSAIIDVLIEFVVVLAVDDELIRRTVDPHKSIQGRPLQTSDLSYEDLIEPIIYVLILLLLDEPALQGQGLPNLLPAEQGVLVYANTPDAAGDIIG